MWFSTFLLLVSPHQQGFGQLHGALAWPVICLGLCHKIGFLASPPRSVRPDQRG